MWFFAHKTMFRKGAATLELSKVGGIMIKAGQDYRTTGKDANRRLSKSAATQTDE